MRATTMLSLFGAFTLAFSAAACEQASPVEQATVEPQFSSSGPELVECPIDTSTSAESTLGPLGGSLQVNGHELSLGTLAVLLPTEFRLTDVASNYVELNLKAAGQESFGFQAPVEITIDYSRCTRENIDKTALTVYKIDPVTKALLKPMGGVDDKVARQITFSTDSLSSYSIAN